MQRDQQVFELIKKEQERQENGIELIASENFASPQVIEAMGTVLSNWQLTEPRNFSGHPGQMCNRIPALRPMRR